MTEHVVLGIDAAWTAAQPSGVALAAESGGHWKLLAVAPSYLDFLKSFDIALEPSVKPRGSPIDAKALLAVSEVHAGKSVDLVAVDMPLARTPITARRASDDAVSRAYGSRWCSTHTPSATRPGPIAESLGNAFAAEGYPLITQKLARPALVEVYPHPALVELANADKRLTYKAQKTGLYWPDLIPNERKQALLKTWNQIIELLDDKIAGTRALLPKVTANDRGATLKAFEDMLDAVVCAWVGIAVLTGQAEPYGDVDSAIWIPSCSHKLKAI